MDERGQSGLRLLDRWLGIPLTLPAAAMRKLDRRPKKSTGRIAILCLGAIGDLLLLTSLSNAIKLQLPHCSIEILASAANAQALPLLPHIDGHFTAPVRRIGSFIAHARKRQYDVFLDASQWARAGALISACSGARLTVGFKTAGQFRHLPYDLTVEHSARRHEAENFLALGQAVWPEIAAKPALALASPRPAAPDKIVYCHMWPAPGKGRQLKQWPPELWAGLVTKLLAAGYEVKLTGSGADSAACQEFLQKYFPAQAAVQNIAGAVSLTELARLFRKAAAIVSVNTGIMHLAALSGAPCVGLHGATNPARWGPAGENCASLLPRQGEFAYLNLGFEYPPAAENAMRHLPVEDVLKALRSLGVKL